MDPSIKQVKVDNWGIYFLQRLKHFFNRTDYCDMTLQFQDNAQLKVHRLVLSACTEYFEALERTCEMYEECMVMPEDLQADVVVPIVNFMYTGQLEFRLESLERLYQTSQIMRMPVLTKLLEAHRSQLKPKQVVSYSSAKRPYAKAVDIKIAPAKSSIPISSTSAAKRSFTKAFATTSKSEPIGEVSNGPYSSSMPITFSSVSTPKKAKPGEPRPTRYDLPEELDGSIFDDSFSNISYTSEPLMIHPETRKRYPSKKPATAMFSEASSSKKPSGLIDIMESKKVLKTKNIFEDETPADLLDEQVEMFQPVHVKRERTTFSEHLFDQIMDVPANHDRQEGHPNVTIETKNSKQVSNVDHAKIISEVLKKYPHLMKSNKNIKLKILNSASTQQASPSAKKKLASPKLGELKVKTEEPDYTFESDVMDSKEAAKLIAMGVENVKGPWICLICGTPGRALHFSSYYKFRRHLVEVHQEKPTLNICEYCGLKSTKRNYMLHHLYTKHGVEPPPAYHFPKCTQCSYIALTEALLVKHKQSHMDTRNFRCNVCPSTFSTSVQLLSHIQVTGHKYSAERKTNLQCIYCLKVFLRESNLYTHIKANHKGLAIQDGIIDDSDEDNRPEEEVIPTNHPSLVKYEQPRFTEYADTQTQQYEIRPDGNVELVTKKPTVTKQKILNVGYGKQGARPPKAKPVKRIANEDFSHEVAISSDNMEQDEVVMIDNNEYIVRDNQLILKKKAVSNEQYILGDVIPSGVEDTLQSTNTVEYTDINHPVPEECMQEQGTKIIMKNPGNMNQSLIVVSNEEEYKALMNANHSIIFDDGEANKTLTVLSTPHGATLGATRIDSGNTQTNDIMIIQEDYPLNVSEGLPLDNNVMVVYSQSNKPYQIITSQGLGGQFVQNTLVTQNLEAINTSTPVVTDHQTVIIDTHQAASWQTSIPIENQMPEEAPPVHQMTIVEATDITSENGSMTELPEVTVQGTTVESEENISETSNTEGTAENIPQQLPEDEPQNEAETLIEVDESPESQELRAENSEAQPDEAEIQDELNEKDDRTTEDSVVEEEIVEEQSAEEIEQAEITESTEVIDCNSNSDDVMQDESHEEPAQATIASTEDPTPTEVAKVPAETLATEWSEDEYDTNEESANQQPNDNEQTAEHSEVEESIENIQQEMEKQMSEAPEVDMDTEVNEHSQENQSNTQRQAAESEASTQPPQEKISSLLNDWEDGESHDDTDPTNEKVGDVSDMDVIEKNTGPKEVANGADKAEPLKDDKLKSLVSDWDEEEEEKS